MKYGVPVAMSANVIAIALAGMRPFMTMILVHREWLVFWRHPGQRCRYRRSNGSGSICGERFACSRESGGDGRNSQPSLVLAVNQRARPASLESSSIRRKKQHRQKKASFRNVPPFAVCSVPHSPFTVVFVRFSALFETFGFGTIISPTSRSVPFR